MSASFPSHRFLSRLLCAGVCVSLLTACALPLLPVAGAQKARRKPPTSKPKGSPIAPWSFQMEKGRSWRVRHQGDINVTTPGGESLHFEGEDVVLLTVTEVAENGDITVTEIEEESRTTLNGRSLPREQSSVQETLVIGRDGLHKKYRVESGSGNSEQVRQILATITTKPVAPRAVRIGDSWKSQIPNLAVEGRMETMTSTLLGREKRKGVELLKIMTRCRIAPEAESAANEYITAQNTYYLDPKTSTIVQRELQAKNIPIAANVVLKGNVSETETLEE